MWLYCISYIYSTMQTRYLWSRKWWYRRQVKFLEIFKPWEVYSCLQVVTTCLIDWLCKRCTPREDPLMAQATWSDHKLQHHYRSMTDWNWWLVYTRTGFFSLEGCSELTPVDSWHMYVHILFLLMFYNDVQQHQMQLAMARQSFGRTIFWRGLYDRC